MFQLFNRSPLRKWEKEHRVLLTKAFQAQRNGDIRLYSTLTAEAEALREKIESLKNRRERSSRIHIEGNNGFYATVLVFQHPVATKA